MKTVLFMRHAKSDWSVDVSDIDRPLKKRGIKAACGMGLFLKQKNCLPDQLLSSPACRAQETAKLVAKKLNCTNNVVLEDSFYFGGENRVIEVIKQLDNSLASVMVFGHNPDWENAVYKLVKSFQTDKFPTAAIAKVRFYVDNWNKISIHNSDLEWFIKPTDVL